MTFIFSQIFVCLCYLFLGLTYVIKKRTLILIFSLAALLFNGLHYSLLGAWAGVGVVCIAVVRNVLFLVQQKIKALDKYVIDDWIILIFLLIISALTAVWTYDGILSLFSIFASVIYTVSVWQKNIKVYKILGIISGIINIVYFVFIGSIFGIILETIVCLITIVFTIIYILSERKEKLSGVKNELESQKGEV
jgi:hypothetical protein